MTGGRRKVPFSAKAKKQQLKQKRAVKSEAAGKGEDQYKSVQIQKLPQSGRSNVYALQFARETQEEIEKQKQEAFQPISRLDEKMLEVDGSEMYPSHLTIPERPSWNYDMNKEALEAKENAYFKKWLYETKKHQVSYFEQNLETWRQLWRVLERADILLFLTDIRFAGIQFSVTLFRHVTVKLNKKMILVLNKADLVPPALAVAWKKYFEESYPGLKVTFFSSLSGLQRHGLKSYTRQIHGSSPESSLAILEAIKQCDQTAELDSWIERIQQKIDKEENEDEEDDRQKEFKRTVAETGIKPVTIGLIGTPNVGKSSVLNALKGRKVVSVSKTPGHTKHFQTIFITPTVILCDCPGLVFPSLVPKGLQILSGCYPIAQVRQPAYYVKFIAERIPLPEILKLSLPEGDDTWSAVTICDSWAEKKQFKTAKSSRNDWHRAGNHILRMTLDGALCIYFSPPGYTESSKDVWESSPDMALLQKIITHPARILRQKVEEKLEGKENDSEDKESDEDSEHQELEEDSEHDEAGEDSEHKESDEDS